MRQLVYQLCYTRHQGWCYFSQIAPALKNIAKFQNMTRIVAFFGKIFLMTVLFRSLTVDFFPTIWWWWDSNSDWFLFRNLNEQVSMVVFPTSNQKVLSLSFINTMIHVCARFPCSAQWTSKFLSLIQSSGWISTQ